MIRQAKKLLAAIVARRFAEAVGRALVALERFGLAVPEHRHDKGRREDGLQEGAQCREAGADDGDVDLGAAPDADAVVGPCGILAGEKGSLEVLGRILTCWIVFVETEQEDEAQDAGYDDAGLDCQCDRSLHLGPWRLQAS